MQTELNIDCDIVEANRETDYDGWLENRRKTIGSSTIPVVLGLSKYKTPLELWAELTGKVTSYRVDSRAARYGRKVEKTILELFSEDHPELTMVVNDKTYRSRSVPFACATPDSHLLHKENGRGIAEAKHSAINFDDWRDGDAPSIVQAQVIWQMGVLNCPYAYVPAVIGGRANTVVEPCIVWDSTALDIWNVSVEAAYQFLQKVERDIPPGVAPGDNDRKVVERLIAGYENPASVAQLGEEFARPVREIVTSRAQKSILNKQVKDLDTVIKHAEAELILAAAGAPLVRLPDGTEVAFKQVKRKGYEVQPTSYWTVNV